MSLTPAAFARLCRARALLDEPVVVPRSVRAVARQVGISPFHFIRQFEALFGRTPHQYRIEQQLRRAKLLLARGHSVTEACMGVGLSSLGSFSASFRRRQGESPSRFGRRARALPPPGLQPGCLSLMAHLPAGAIATMEKPPALRPCYRRGHAEER